MARVRTTTCNGQGREKKCSSCGKVIEKGEKYLWAKPGFRRRIPVIRCLKHPFRESDLITGNRAEIVRAKEDAIDAIEAAWTIEEIESAMRDFESAADDYVLLREEALDAWPNGNSQLEEYVYQAEAIQSEVSGWAPDYSDSDEPDEVDIKDAAYQAQESGESFNTDNWIESWREERLEEVKDSARDLLEGLDA